MPERIRFNPQNVGLERPYSRLSEGFSREQLAHVRDRLEFIAGVTAVHGLEPQQIAINNGLAINRVFRRYGLPALPIIIPFIPGHAIYGDRTHRVLDSVYDEQAQGQIFLSEDLGRALLHTEFGFAGYQQHLANVQRDIQQVYSAFQELLSGPFSVSTFNGKQRRLIDPTQRRTLEINAGANATLAQVSDQVDAYEVFPVTFDGLIQYIRRHNSFFRYDQQLIQGVEQLAIDLRLHTKGMILPDLHTLGEERWFEGAFPEAFITPPWKEKLTPPRIEIDSEERTITVFNHTGLVDKVHGYDPEKGIVYINVSGSDLGAQAAKMFALNAQDQGYVVSATPWVKEKWLKEEDGSQLEASMRNVLAAEPHILFAKTKDGTLCKAFFMRLGMGSYAYAQLAGVPIIFLGFEALENPEMKGNESVVEKYGLGARYTGQPNIITEVEPLANNFSSFNGIVYYLYGIPKRLEGLDANAQIILLDQIHRLFQR